MHAFGISSLYSLWQLATTGTAVPTLTMAPTAALAAACSGLDSWERQLHSVVRMGMCGVAAATSTGGAAAARAVSTPGILAARGTRPTRPPCCPMRPRCGCKEEGRRLAGAGLGGTVANAALAKTEGRSPPCRAAPSIAAVGDGGEWPTS